MGTAAPPTRAHLRLVKAGPLSRNLTYLASRHVPSSRLLFALVPLSLIPALVALIPQVQPLLTPIHLLLPHIQPPAQVLPLKELHSGGHKRHHVRP